MDSLFVFESHSCCMSGLIHRNPISSQIFNIDQLMLRLRAESTLFLKLKSFFFSRFHSKISKSIRFLFRFKNPSVKFVCFDDESTLLCLKCVCCWFGVDLFRNPQIWFETLVSNGCVLNRSDGFSSVYCRKMAKAVRLWLVWVDSS